MLPRRTASRWSWLWPSLLLLCLVLAAGGVTWFLLGTASPASQPADPRVTSDSPFLNIRPEVAYVGDEACVSCHADLAKTYAGHSMGRSMEPVAGSAFGEQFTSEARATFVRAGFRYTAERQHDRWLHHEEPLRGSTASLRATCEVQHAVGGGGRARSYFHSRDGFVFQSPLTWFPRQAHWDISPGYENNNPHFDRPAVGWCLYCHVNQVEPIPHTINRYREPIFRGNAIGCERCHGPGELHVRRQEWRDGMDVTIVNPKHLSPALRDAVCDQCHVEGEQRILRRGRGLFDYRPGLPLHEFVSIYVKPKLDENELRFVGHVDQLHTSKCYLSSSGKMSCTTCHDPHASPAAAARVGYYRQRCLQCHEKQGCSLPVTERLQANAEDSCMDCHMPATRSEIQHAAVTDHRIRRSPNLLKAKTAARPAPADSHGLRPYVLYHEQDRPRDDPDRDRDYGIALIESARFELISTASTPRAARQALAQAVLPLLDPAVRRDPSDLAALEARAAALWLNEQHDEAARAYELLLRREPHHEVALREAARLALETNRLQEAIELGQRLVAVSPYRWHYHSQLALALLSDRQSQAAQAACEAALAVYPLAVEPRKLLVAALLDQGERAKADREFRLLLELDPPDRTALEAWYAERTRQPAR